MPEYEDESERGKENAHADKVMPLAVIKGQQRTATTPEVEERRVAWIREIRP